MDIFGLLGCFIGFTFAMVLVTNWAFNTYNNFFADIIAPISIFGIIGGAVISIIIFVAIFVGHDKTYTQEVEYKIVDAGNSEVIVSVKEANKTKLITFNSYRDCTLILSDAKLIKHEYDNHIGVRLSEINYIPESFEKEPQEKEGSE